MTTANQVIRGIIVETAHLNQMGVLLFGHNRDAEAQRYLRQGVIRLQEAYHEQMQLVPPVLGNNHNAPRTTSLAPAVTLLRSVPMENLADERFYIFRHALILGLPTSSNSSSTDANSPSLIRRRDITLCTCGLLFNLALLFHQRAVTTGSHRAFAFAFNFYNQVWSILIGRNNPNIIGNGIAGDDHDMRLLKIVVANNLAHICYVELADFTLALNYLEAIRQDLSALEDAAGPSYEGRGAFAELEAEELMLNIVALQQTSPTTARAA